MKRWNHPIVDGMYPALLVREVRIGHHQMLVRSVAKGRLAAVQLDQVALQAVPLAQEGAIGCNDVHIEAMFAEFWGISRDRKT
jgi:hypothetical protein